MQSHVVSGYVGNKNAVFALNRLGFEVDALNTTQLSNHTGFPEVTGQRLGGADVRALWDGMKANGLTNQTHVLSGYIGDPSIVEELAAIVRELPGREYVADPVFGDEGKLYVSSAIPRRFEELLLPEIRALAGHPGAPSPNLIEPAVPSFAAREVTGGPAD